MKTRTPALLLLIGTIGVLTLGVTFAQQENAGIKAQAAAMQKWLATLNPSEHHEKLNKLTGTFTTLTRMYFGGPGSPAVESSGTSKKKWVLGKRHIMEEHKGFMMMPDLKTGGLKKTPYEGIGFMGYDNYRNMYTGAWRSNLGTNVISHTGSMDPDGKILRSYGKMDEPMLDVIGRTVKYELIITSKDQHILKVYDLHAGDDYLVFDITYTRKAD
mgnify:CR=1 FL=1